MKDLNYNELLNAPALIQFVYTSSLTGQRIGSDIIYEAVENYPEYFADILPNRKKYDSIPQYVHDAYYKELWELQVITYIGMPEIRGRFYWVLHPEKLAEWKIEYDKRREREIPLEKEIHEKYYSQYGI